MSGREIDLGGGAPAGGLLRRPRRDPAVAVDGASPAAEDGRPSLAVVPPATEEPTSAPDPETPTTPSPEIKREAKPRSSRTPTRAPAKPAEDEESRKERVGGYTTSKVRSRAVAAHQATLYQEGETSWTEFVEKAIIAETERRERQYNDGQPFELRSGGKLKTGRPLHG